MLKTHAELRRENDIDLVQKKDSEYLIHDETVDRERDERVFAPLKVPQKLAASLPFKQQDKVRTYNDQTAIDKRRQTNLLTALNLPTKRPFKKMFMSKDERDTYSMVQRLGNLAKDYQKEKEQKNEEKKQLKKKREAKVTAKREAYNK